ncbi:putative primosomal protein N' [Luteimicrobium album]|uniref:Probable replication restart protein PriA n=1 Tax=Luteimicrobium album TaxID=1054550 RepID=A0ABQ6I597_9MICO|nr:primosomal protein N' [Luteimicrobium album]GMA25930.1 putative primosomal protein N' [Luteimicrobium album]
MVPADAAETARPGVRVKVRFGAQDVGGFLVDRAASSEHGDRLVPLRRVVSPEPVLTPAVLRLARAVADRYAGTLADVLRLAVPPRHARTEQATHAGPTTDSLPPLAEAPGEWRPYRGGVALLRHLAAGGAPRAAWTALPGPDPLVDTGAHWAAALAEAVRVAVGAGRGALVVLPDARDVARLSRALEARGLPPWVPATGGRVAHLTAEDGPSARYAQFLAVLRGDVPVAIGTRAAAFAPVHDLGLVVCWDDTADTHAEPRAPYPHTREVLALRAELERCAFVVGSHARTTATQALVARGWAKDVVAPRAVVRERTPRVRALTSVELAKEGPGAAARLPAPALHAVRQALESGPVLVQVPRSGYVPVVACGRCRTPARCATCHGPLGLTGGRSDPQCRWCGRLAVDWTCAECGGHGLRATAVGSGRTAEELGRAFPGVTVRVSGAATGVLDTVPARRAIVVATPGAEPVAPGGFVCALLLDAAASTAGRGLGVAQDALARWLAAASLVRRAPDGGQVLLVGDAAPAPTGALVRWDPVGLAARELEEVTELGLPPAVRMASVEGERTAVSAVVGRVALATGDAVLGPVTLEPAPSSRGGRSSDDALVLPGSEPVRVLVRVPWEQGRELARQLAASLAVRSARREGGDVRVRLDPREIV